MLSQSPPVIDQTQLVAWETADGSLNQDAALTSSGSAVGGGYGTVSTGAVGQVMTAVLHAQLSPVGFSALPSQLKSPGAHTSFAYGGWAPRQVPFQVGEPSPCCWHATVPTEFVAHQPTGSPSWLCVAGTR